MSASARAPVCGAVAAAKLRHRCDLQMCELPFSLSDFVERHNAPDRRQVPAPGLNLIRISRGNAYFPACLNPYLNPAFQRRNQGACPHRLDPRIKHDGYRVQFHTHKDTIKIFTRRGNDWTRRFSKVAADAY
jgi:hypothetical protein